MDFELTHSFDAPPEKVAEALLDEGFQASLATVSALSDRRVLSQEAMGDGLIQRRVRCVLGMNVDGPAKSFLGDAEPAWIEEATWHPQEMRWNWLIVPEVAAELLRARGTIELLPEGEGTARRVSGTVNIRVPLYGARVENLIVEGLRKAYGEEAERLAAWLTS